MIFDIVALGVLTYISASALFWHFPHLIHTKKKIKFNVRHISHRGGSAEGYENTLKNFKRAVASGTEMLELDVRLTKDGKVVVFHDKDMIRVTGVSKSISDFEYDQLPTLSLTVPVDTIPGVSYTDALSTEADRRIPLLSEVFQAFPRLPINIDLKDNNSPQLINEVEKMIKEFNRHDITVWGSFNHKDSKLLFQADPSIGLFFSGRRVLLLLLCTVTGILPFIPLRETHYEVFLPLCIRRRRLAEVESLALHEKLLFWFCDTLLVWRPLISHLRKRGIQVYLWVANEEDEYAECLRIGADGIMTDYPSKLRQYLDKYFPNDSDLINSNQNTLLSEYK